MEEMSRPPEMNPGPCVHAARTTLKKNPRGSGFGAPEAGSGSPAFLFCALLRESGGRGRATPRAAGSDPAPDAAAGVPVVVRPSGAYEVSVLILSADPSGESGRNVSRRFKRGLH